LVSGSVIWTASSVGGLAATAPPRLLPAAGRPTTANPGRPRLPAAGPAPSGDTRATASRDATAIRPEPNKATWQAKFTQYISGIRYACRVPFELEFKSLT
jgi:hypothetical protein